MTNDTANRKPRCHEVEDCRKGRVTLVDCLSEASFLERRSFREAQNRPEDRVTGRPFFWFVFFGRVKCCFQGPSRKMNKEYSRRVGRTYQGLRSEAKGID
jgi:hypothetical protein